MITDMSVNRTTTRHQGVLPGFNAEDAETRRRRKARERSFHRRRARAFFKPLIEGPRPMQGGD